VRCTTGAGAGGGGGAVLVVLEKEKQPEPSVAAAKTSPRDKNFIMMVPKAKALASHVANPILHRQPREVFMASADASSLLRSTGAIADVPPNYRFGGSVIKGACRTGRPGERRAGPASAPR
jgi:hypothetical protein